jgi:hypothetical protein
MSEQELWPDRFGVYKWEEHFRAFEGLWTIVAAFNRAVFYYYKEKIDLFTQKKQEKNMIR